MKTCGLPRGVLSTKDPMGTCHQHGWQNQPPGISMTPYFMQNFGIKMGQLFKFFLNLSQNGLKENEK